MNVKNVLLVYPEYPDTFWGWKRIMKIINRKAAFPPLGLLTIAAMLPESCDIKLVDMNVSALKVEDILFADYVFVSAMITQRESVIKVIDRCKTWGKIVVAGGPLFTTGYKDSAFDGVNHFVVGEAEDIFAKFWEDLKNGVAEKIYSSDTRPNISKAPIPLWSLIDPDDYVSLSVQTSRGCPFNCEFCDVIVMNGRIPRVKSPEQVVREIVAIRQTGFHGTVLVVDDNFIGNKVKVKAILPELISWQEKNGFPFSFSTEASINLADEEVLMEMMVAAGFGQVFLGLETPSSAGLEECGKVQNTNRNVIASIKKIQKYGLHTLGGFIVGFDSDTSNIFQDQIDFIQKAGVVVAMIGMLQALPETRLYKRLLGEGRISGVSSGNNMDDCTNFEPIMGRQVLLDGYKKVLEVIYSPKKYYERMCTFLDEYNSHEKTVRLVRKINWLNLAAFARSIWYIGIFGEREYKWYYWKMLFTAIIKYRKDFPEAVAMLIYGMHMREIALGIQNS